MFKNSGKIPKRIWILAIFNIVAISFSLAANLLWIYPQESDNPLSYFWTYKCASFLFLTIIVTSIGILIGGNNWRIALAILVSLNFGGKIIEQIYLIVTRYDSMVGSILYGELIGTSIILFELSLNYWILFSKKANQYFSSKIKDSKI